MTKNKITKQDLWTEIKILNAKLDKVLDLLQSNKAMNELVKYSEELGLYKQPFVGDPPYALSSGSLSDGGTTQTWRPSGDVNL